MLRLIFTLLLTITSCSRAGTWPAYVKIDKSVEPLLANSLINYTRQLNEALGSNALQFGEMPDAEKIQAYPIVVRYSSELSDMGAAGLAEYDSYSCIVTIYPTALKEDLLKTVLWHEYAHCLGIPHNTARDEIMSPSVYKFRFYSNNAVNRFLSEFKMILRMISR